MASSKAEHGMWTCTAGELRNFERLLGRRFSAEDIKAADDEAVFAAWSAFRQSLEERSRLSSEVERLLGSTIRVHVDYQMPRDKETLEAEFSENGVSKFFYGDYEWQLHSMCHGMDQAPGEREFLVKHFNRKIESNEAIAEMGKLGYRPAIHLEAYAFAKMNPELQRRFWIVALGSFTMPHSSQRVAVLRSDSGRRVLHSGWYDGGFYAYRRFLFVRKASS